jgi:iron complex outermembrane receptor protein
MKNALAVVFISFLWINSSFSQFNGGGGNMPEFNLTGRVIDATNNKPIPFATVYLKHLKDSTFFSGGLANDSGVFSIEQLKPGRYELKISFIGYKGYVDTITLKPPDLKMDLGIIKLLAEATDINEYTFSEDKPDFQLGIDRKIFNVDKNNIATGGSALDVMRQVPTLTVDVDGSITLRGSGSFVIFINGKTSGITADNRTQILQQIPASNIERIELITNPSAKFDAEGMTGIINIVTKQQLANGKSGQIQIGIGTGNKYNASGTFNLRVKNFAMTHTIGFRYSQYWNEGYNLRTNTPTGMSPNSINQYNTGFRNTIAPTISGNFEWGLKKDASISVNYLFSYGNNSNPDSLRYDYLDSSAFLTAQSYRITKAIENNYSADGGITFNKKFKKDREIVVAANVNYNNNGEVDNYRQMAYTALHQPDTNYHALLQNITKSNASIVSTLQLDYTHPFKEKFKFETGFKITLRDINNTMIADTFDYSLGRNTVDSTITNKFHYLDNVNAVYGTFSANFKKWGFQTGLRIEQTNVVANQETGNVQFTKNYINFFPSAFVNYKITESHTLQLAYSRRINRPGMGQLNPFAQYDDPLNLRIGNPNLNPENVDAVELNYNMNVSTKKRMNHNLIVTGYFRMIHGVIQRYRYIDTNNVSIVTFLNLDESVNFGGEVVLRNSWFKWWSMTSNFNIYRNQIIGSSPTGNLQATNFSYSIRNQQSFKMGKVAELQLSLNYMAPQTFPQGLMKEMWNVDASIRFDMFKNRASFTFNITDIFNTRRFAIYSSDPYFHGDIYRKRESRIFTFQFTWKFGDLPGSDKSKRKNNNNQGGGGDPDMGM